MAAITVPDKEKKALGELANLPGSRLSSLIESLRSAQATLLVRDLAAQVAPKAEMEEREVLRFIRLLATMYAVRTREGLSVEHFADEIYRAAEEGGLQLDPETRERFKRYLQELLSIESLFVTAKALEISREHEHVLCEPRIITDMRPIFGLNDEAVAVVPVHVLRLAYHVGSTDPETKEFFVALTSDNVRDLKKLAIRAEAKERKLKALADKLNWLWLERKADE